MPDGRSLVLAAVVAVVALCASCTTPSEDEPREPEIQTSNIGDACATEADCDAALECVPLDGATAECTVPVGAGEACACVPNEYGACTVTRTDDGCTDDLRCEGVRFNGVGETASDPVCVHSPSIENERCGWTNQGANLQCAEGLECAFGVGICVPVDCEIDDDCPAPAVCVRGCLAACGPPAEPGDVCHLDGYEMCPFDRSCAAGLTCNRVGLGDQNGERICE